MGLMASRTIKIQLQFLSLPSFTPSMILGRSSNFGFAPPQLPTPGIHVTVVNSYNPPLEKVSVNLFPSPTRKSILVRGAGMSCWAWPLANQMIGDSLFFLVLAIFTASFHIYMIDSKDASFT